MNKKITHIPALALFALLILILFLNRETNYTLPGEYRWTLPTIVETHVEDNWFVPKLDGKPRFRKPPLVYWSILFFSKAFDLNLFWVRFPIVIFSILSIVLFYIMLSQLKLDKQNIITACLLLLTSSGFYMYSRIAALEIPMLFFTLGVYYGLLLLLIKEEKKGIIISAVFLGLTLLTKSHATLFSFVVFLLLWNWRYKKWGMFKEYKREWLLFFAILILITVPWYLYLYVVYKSEFLMALNKELTRDNNRGSYRFFGMLFGMVVLTIPYAFFFLNSLYCSMKNRSKEYFFFAMYILSIIVPYVFITSQKMRYMVPLLPACTALIALSFNGKCGKNALLPKLTGLIFVLIPGFLACGLMIWFKLFSPPVVIVMSLGIIIAFMMYWKCKLLKAAVLTGLFEFVMIGMVYSQIGLWRVPENIVTKLKNEKVATFNRRPVFLPVKLKNPAFTNVTWWDNLDKAVADNALIFVPQHKMKKFKKMLNERGYSTYKKYFVWRRINEFAKNKEIKKALLARDLSILEEDTFFIGDIK
jgi:4-amino-4-deoxy-L-arabinose transferase-like glycosyltransferase